MYYYHIMDKIIDSKDFSTGGGSASAIAGSMAAGLVAMVGRLSINKKYGLSDEEYEEIIADGDRISQELLIGAKQDAEAYMLIKDAYMLPKDTENNREIRRQAIQNAGIEAASVPLKNATKCKEIYKLCVKLKGKSNLNAVSDLMGAEALSKAGVEGCLLNIEVNLSLIKDEKTIEQFERQIVELREAILEL